MAVVIINPNSTVSMTKAMTDAAADAVRDVQFEGWTSHLGPPAIQGRADGDAATAPLLDLVRKAEADGADGVVIGCFDDTALAEAAQLASVPVIGIGQASYHYAALRQWRFSVVTTLPASLPVLDDNIHRLGFAAYKARVRASNVPVLALEDDPDAAERAIVQEARVSANEDAIDALILGCAGMVHVTDAVRKAVPLPVLDPVICAAKAMRWLL